MVIRLSSGGFGDFYTMKKREEAWDRYLGHLLSSAAGGGGSRPSEDEAPYLASPYVSST